MNLRIPLLLIIVVIVHQYCSGQCFVFEYYGPADKVFPKSVYCHSRGLKKSVIDSSKSSDLVYRFKLDSQTFELIRAYFLVDQQMDTLSKSELGEFIRIDYLALKRKSWKIRVYRAQRMFGQLKEILSKNSQEAGELIVDDLNRFLQIR